MCGITGFLGDQACSVQVLQRMSALQHHRGPDSQGEFLSPEHGLGMAIARLSIIDLAGGDQPICNEDGSVVVVYNGEIYNFRELRQELEGLGHRFRTHSDTEVIVHAYEAWGPKAPARFNGMFAYALWDRNHRRLVLVRDPMGIKPLHYFLGADGFIVFGSEIKSLLAHPAVPRALDYQSLHDHLNLGYVPGTGTLFNGIKRLPAGHMMVLEGSQASIQQYWTLTPSIDRSLSPTDWCQGIREHVEQAVQRHLISDVPVGVYLSGGMDSSTLVAYASKAYPGRLQTFCLGFNQPTDELADAAALARHFGTEHHELRLDPEPLRSLPEVIYHVEEPKVNQLQGYLLSRFARQFVKVVLTGMGGDELFGGYVHYALFRAGAYVSNLFPGPISNLGCTSASWVFRLFDQTGRLQWGQLGRTLQLGLAARHRAHFYGISRNVWDYDPGMWAHVYHPTMRQRKLERVERLLEPLFPNDGRTFVEQGTFAELFLKMRDDFLVNEDRTSMAVSLESRPPFLDKELVEFATRIPGKFKVSPILQLRPLFRQAMAPVLPTQTLRKKKGGFAFDPYWQARKDLRAVAQKVLTKRRLDDQGIFNYDYIQKILASPPSPRLRWHYRLVWLILGFQLWFEIFLGGRFPIAAGDLTLERFYSAPS